MTTNRITETKTVDEENFSFVLAESNYKLQSIFRSKNPQVNIFPNNSMTAAHNSISYAIPPTANVTNITPRDTSKSGSFTFTINHTRTALIDLKDFYFDINAFVYGWYNRTAGSGEEIPSKVEDIRWSTQPLLSLFDNFALFIDDVLIEKSNFASLSANLRYALEYPHNPIAENSFQVNGWQFSDYVSNITRTTVSDGTATIIPNNTISGAVYYDTSSTYSGYLLYANICQKIKLSDIFSCINTLPPFFDHTIRVMLVRASNSYIGCDTRNPNLNIQLDAFQQFKLTGCSYIITDQLKNACEKYYSKKIETLFTSRTEIINSIPSDPTQNSDISFVINTNLAYKNRCLVICSMSLQDLITKSLPPLQILRSPESRCSRGGPMRKTDL